MAWFIIIIGVGFLVYLINKIDVNDQKPKIENGIRIEVDVPNPEKCQDKTMIDFISSTPNYKLEPIFKEYSKLNLILKPIYIEAFNQKINIGSIDTDYFHTQIGIELPTEILETKKKNEFTDKQISLKKWADDNQEEEEKEENKLTAEDFMRFKTNKIESVFLKPQKDLEDQSHYFFGKKIVITGSIECFPYRNELGELLWSVGADIDTAVGKNTDIVILGDSAGWKKMELIEKFQPEVIDQDILMEYFPNYKPKFKSYAECI